MRVITTKPRKHPEGWAVDLLTGEDVKLATTYGGDPDEATRRATKAAWAFEQLDEVRP